MTETSNALPNKIRSRYDNSIIYTSKTAKTIAETLVEAVAAGAYLGGANLGGAYLRDAYLGGANLGGAYLGGANLRDANLGGAYLRDANLGGAYLRDAYLGGAYLRDAYLRDAYLGGANLGGANLGGANLGGAYLGGAYLGDDGKILSVASIQFTGHGACGRTLIAVQAEKTTRIFCGCFNGTPDELRAWIGRNEATLRRTRTLALDTALMLLSVKNDTEEDLARAEAEKAKPLAAVAPKPKRRAASKKAAKKPSKRSHK